MAIDSFNKIYNYINKNDCILKLEDFVTTNNPGDILNISNPSPCDNKSFSICSIPQVRNTPYSSLVCLGSFLNTNIYTFTKASNYKENLNLTNEFNNISKISNFFSPANTSKNLVTNKPQIKNLVKLIKCLSEAFPHYSEEFFMYHIYSRTGFNSGREAQIQIQLTEIKQQLNKKKLKNLDNIKSNFNKSNYSINSKIFKNNNSVNSNKTSHYPSKIIVSNFNSNVDKVNFSNRYNIHNPNTSKNLKPNITLNTYRSMNSKHLKTVSNPLMNNLMKLNSNTSQAKSFKNVNSEINVRDSNELCNNFASPVESKMRVDLRSQFENVNLSNNFSSTGREKDANTNSKIYVVSRDNNLRFKTEFNISQDSSLDCDISSENNCKKTNISMSEECYNTPTKKKVIRYYS